MADGQLALNSADASPGLFFKNSVGTLVKAGPVHVGTTAPNSAPAVGGQTGNSTGELWLDTSLTPNELKTWNGTAWVSATGQEIPVSKLINGSARQLLQTNAAGTDVEWTSDVDVPGTLTKGGNNVVTVGDTGTVTSTMIADGTIVDGDVNASAAIAGTKIQQGSTSVRGTLQLTDSTSSTSTTTAATPDAVKSAYDLANAALPKSGGTMTGTITFSGSQTFPGTLNSSDIGVTVQGYDVNTAKLDVAQTFSAEQTFTEIKETVYTLGTTGTIALDPANGSIQSSVLTGAPTFTDSLASGQTIVLHLEGGATYTVTWPTITWVTGSGNTAPTLTAKDTLVLWKISTTLYGAYVGSYV